MRVIGVIALIFIFSFSLAAQGVLKGKVSAIEGEPLSFANISIVLPDGKVLGTSTDLDGNYMMKLDPGNYSVKASYIGYTTKKIENVNVQEGEIVALYFELEEDTRVIACPVITYDRRPFTLQKIHQEEIEKQNLGQDVPFLLKMTPSAVVTSDAGGGVGYTAIRVRGSDQTNINVTVNGIPLNDSESHQVYWVDLPDIMASANSIEIERGVGASKNGAGAFGATINVDTKMASPKPSLILASTVGSFKTQKYSLEAGTGNLLDKKSEDELSFTGRVSRIKSAGYIDRAASSLNSYFLSANFSHNQSSLKLNMFSGHEITYQSWYGVPLNYVGIDSLRTYNEAGQERSDKPHPDQVDNYKQTHYQAIYANRIDDIKINAALHYTKGEGYYEQFKKGQNVFIYGSDSLFTGGVLVEESDLIRRKWLDNDFYGSVINITIPTWAKVDIGGGWNEYLGDHFGKVVWAQQSGIPQGHEYYRNKAKKNDFNIYAKAEKSFLNYYKAYIDLQYRKVKYAFVGIEDGGGILPSTVKHHFFNPKVGGSVLMGGKLFYASMAVGHREPNRNDYRSNPISRKPKAERLIDWELGMRKQHGQFRYAVNGFLMNYKNQLVLTGKLTEVGEYARVNVPKSYRLGVETNAAYQISNLIGLSGNLTLSKNKIKTFTEYIDNWDTWAQETVLHENTNLAFSPNITAALAFNFSLLDNKLNASLAGKYVGKQYLDNTSNDATSLKSYLYNDLQINYLLSKKKVEYLLNLKVLNLFNQKYSANGWAYRYRTANEYLGPYDQREGNGTYSQVGLYPQAGINFLLGLVVKI